VKAYAAMAAGKPLEPFEYELGEIGEDQVDIDVTSCGICHSDLSMLDNEWGMAEYPLVPGHEVVGTIAAVGGAATHLKVGQRVGMGWHSGYCMSCGSCLSGDHNLCANSEATIVGRHGGFADKVRASAVSVFPLPQSVDSATAGPLFCGGITVFNPLVQFDVSPTAKVGVIGIGGLGHLALQFLNAWGCEVTAFTSSPAKQEEALKLGAHHALSSRDPSALESVAGHFDLILSTVNIKLDWNTYMSALKPRGRLHFLGATLDLLDLQVFPMILGQRSVSGSPVGSPATIRRMLDFTARHQIKPVTEQFRFEQVNEAIARLKSGQARYRIVLSR